jgi:hypothetical protein
MQPPRWFYAVLAVCAIVLTVSTSSPAHGQLADANLSTVRQFKVIVSADVPADSSALRTTLELTLRRNGVRVVNWMDSASFEGLGVVQLFVSTLPFLEGGQHAGLIFHTDFAVLQYGRIQETMTSKPGPVLFLRTWNTTGVLGYARTDEELGERLRNAVIVDAERLANAYLAVRTR